MADLSPAAQAVLDAFLNGYICKPGCNVAFEADRNGIAAAILALADQVVKEQAEPPCGETEPWPQGYQLMSDSKWEQRQQTRTELLAIVAELEKAYA